MAEQDGSAGKGAFLRVVAENSSMLRSVHIRRKPDINYGQGPTEKTMKQILRLTLICLMLFMGYAASSVAKSETSALI